jgi:hypothetical protein
MNLGELGKATDAVKKGFLGPLAEANASKSNDFVTGKQTEGFEKVLVWYFGKFLGEEIAAAVEGYSSYRSASKLRRDSSLFIGLVGLKPVLPIEGFLWCLDG